MTEEQLGRGMVEVDGIGAVSAFVCLCGHEVAGFLACEGLAGLEGNGLAGGRCGVVVGIVGIDIDRRTVDGEIYLFLLFCFANIVSSSKALIGVGITARRA